MKSRIVTSTALFIMLLASLLMLESCGGCAHRQRRFRNRSQERTEYNNSMKGEQGGATKDFDDTEKHSSKATSITRIQQISESDDYDAMLDCLSEQLQLLRKLKKQYFQGNMSDMEAETRIQEITETYQPVFTALDKASSEGKLNYRQHKRQMKLAGEYLKLMRSCAERLDSDLSKAIPSR